VGRVSPESPRASASSTLPLVLLLVLGAHWGLSFSLAKIATNGGVGPIAYAFWQSAIAGPILTAIAWARVGSAAGVRKHWWFLLVMGLSGFTIPNINMLICVTHLPVGVVAVVVPLAPLITYVLSWAIGIERFNARRVAGIVLGFAGVILLVAPEASLPSRDQAIWVLIATLTPAFYAVSNVYAAQTRPKDLDSMAIAGGMQLINACFILPLMLLMGQWYAFPVPEYTQADLALLIQLWIACFGPVVFLEIVKRAGPVFFSQVGYVVTLAGVLWGMLLFDERHSVWLWAAMGCVFAGVLLVSGAPKSVSRSRG
jgi:drug/metabolite transporter (DMT)-like permease